VVAQCCRAHLTSIGTFSAASLHQHELLGTSGRHQRCGPGPVSKRFLRHRPSLSSEARADTDRQRSDGVDMRCWLFLVFFAGYAQSKSINSDLQCLRAAP